jgi:hypothetical protein
MIFLLEEAVRENNYGAEGTSPPTAQKSNQDDVLFQDPKEYEKMTPEERKAKTDKMLMYWKGKQFAGVR